MKEEEARKAVRCNDGHFVAWVTAREVVQWQPDSRDYEVLVRRSANATWWYDLDHLAQVSVDSGAQVRAGQPIGTAQTFSYNDGPRVAMEFWEYCSCSRRQAATAIQ